MKHRLSICLGVVFLLVTMTLMNSCSKNDEEQMAATYVMKVSNLPSSLQNNTDFVFHIQQIIVGYYDDGVQFIAGDESKAVQSFQNAAKEIQDYCDKTHFDVPANSSFTLNLVHDNAVIRTITITL